MNKVKSLADLKQMKKSVEAKLLLRENSTNPEQHVQVKVAMGTCGIAAGAKEVMDALIVELDSQSVSAVVSQTGCLGQCDAEPTVEVTLPGKEPVVFGHIDLAKTKLLVERYIIKGELIEGVVPVKSHTI